MCLYAHSRTNECLSVGGCNDPAGSLKNLCPDLLLVVFPMFVSAIVSCRESLFGVSESFGTLSSEMRV